MLEDVPPAQLDGIRTLAAAKGVDIVVPHGAVETGPYGSIRVPGTEGGSGFRMVHPDGTVEHLGAVYDPRQTTSEPTSEPIVGGEPPEVRVALGSGGEKFVSKEVAGEGDCTVASLADSALSQGAAKKSIHAEGLNLNDPGDMREFRNRIADQVASKSTDTRPGSAVLLGELSPDGARTVLDRIGPPKASSSSHIDALDLAAPPRPRVTDPVRELSNRLNQDPATVLSTLEHHYSSDGDKGMAQLAAYAKAKVESGGDVPQHRDLLDYAIRERTLAETPLGGEMLQAVAHTLGLDVVVVSDDKPAFHLNGDSAKRVYIHRVATEDGRNHYRALHPETKPSGKPRHSTPSDATEKPHTTTGSGGTRRSRVPVSSRGGHGAVTRRPTGSVSNALHRLAGGAHERTDTALGVDTHTATPRPTTPRNPSPDTANLMQRAGRPHGTALPTPDGFEHTAGPDVLGIRTVPNKPTFLAGLHLDDLPTANQSRFFDAVDLARPDGPPHDLDTLFSGSGTPHDPPRIPKILHSIWLGGPLHADGGDRENFMKTMGSNADKSGFTAVLWTDVPRSEIDSLHALDENAPRTPRQEQIQQMLDWAGTHRVKLANLDEVFAGRDRAELHAEIATERARTTGSGYAGASDLLRLDILHRFGGVYTDGDNRATEKLGERVEEIEADTEHQQFGISKLGASINNSAFVAPPGNRIVHDYRASLKQRYAKTLVDTLTENAARGKAEHIPIARPDQEASRFTSRDVRTEVIARTGPTFWHFDALARSAGAPEDWMGARQWFRTITKEHLEAGSESSWLSDTAPKPATGHTPERAPVHMEPEQTVKAAVAILHREAANREGVLHLPSVMDIVDKAAPEHRDQVWHAVLHTMHETWPARYSKPDIVVSGHFQTPSKKGDPIGRNQSVPRSVKTYLHESGLFPNGTVHTAVGHDFRIPPDDELHRDLTGAGLRNVPAEDARDISRVHKMLFGQARLASAEQIHQADKTLDLLHFTSPGDSRTDPLWAPKALRELTEYRNGNEGNYDATHLNGLLADHAALTRRGQLTPDGYKRRLDYLKAIPEGQDPEKFAGRMSPRPPSRKLFKLSAAQHDERWDRAVDVMALGKELGGLSDQQERGLWKLVGLYRRTPGHGMSDRPLTLRDLAGFRDQLATQHPELGTVTDPRAWTLGMADRAYTLSPESGKLTIDELVQNARQHPGEAPYAREYGPAPEIGKPDLPAFQHPAEADRFRAEYVEARPDGSGIWIRDPRSQHDMQTQHTSTTMLADPGHFSVMLHGSPQHVHVGKTTLSAHDMADLLRHTPEWRNDPRPIRLIACSTGEHDNGFAQQLADLLGVEVKAPNTVVWGVGHGKPYASTLVRRPDGTYRPVKEADGAYRVFTPRRLDPDGSVHSTPIRLDTDYDHLGRKPALTVLSRALAGPFGDTLAGSDPVTRKIVNDWRHLMGQTGGDSEKAFEASETGREALDKVLIPDTVQWMLQHAPAGSEVNQALHVLSDSRLQSQHGGRDEQPLGVAYPQAHVPVTPVPHSFIADRTPTAREARTWTNVLVVADEIGLHPDSTAPGTHLTELSALWNTVETHREVLPAHTAAMERPIRYSDLEGLGRQLGLHRASDETQLEFVQRLSTDIGSFKAAHPHEQLSASAMTRHLESRETSATPSTSVSAPRPARTALLPPRTELTDDQAKALSDSLGGYVPPEGLKKLAAVNLKKFPAFTDPRREPQLSDFTDIVHQLLGPEHDVQTGVATLAAAATRARKAGSLSALDGALVHDDGDFVRAPWSRVRYEAYVPWSDRHAIERDAALLYYHAFGEHAPANPDARATRNMRRAMQVAKLAHSSYDRHGQADPETFYKQLGDRLRPLRNDSGTPADSFKRLLSAAGSGDGRYQNPDFLAGPMHGRLHGVDTPRPLLGHDLPAEHITTSRTLAKKLPGLFTPTDFGGHEQIETRLRALIPGRGPLHFEVGLPTELREGFGAMTDGGLTLRVTRDGHAYDVRLKALLKTAPEPVEESAATAKNESRMFRTGDDGGGSHSTSRTLTVDGGVKAGFGPLGIGANTGTSRIRSRELTSSEAFGGDIYLDPSDGTRRHTVETQVHIEVTDTTTGHWVQDVPAADGPSHTVELRIQDHLTATEGFDATPHAVTKPLDDPSVDHLLGERTGYGDELKHGFLAGLHAKGLTLDEKARGEVNAYFGELSSPHNVAALHSTDPLRRAGLSTSITAKDRDGTAVTLTLGAHAEAKTLTQASTSRAGLKMDTVARHTVKQGVSTGRGGGLPSSLAGTAKSPEGSASVGITGSGNSTRTETASLESAFTVTRTTRAEDENASYQLESKLELHIGIGDQTERITVPDATAWVRLRTADHARLISADGTPERKAAAEGADHLDPHLMTSHDLPLGQVKRIANLDGLYRDLVTKLSDHLPEGATEDLAKLFEDDPSGSFLHGTDDKHQNWRRIVTAVSGPGLAQRADALAGEGVTVKLRIGGKDVPLRLSIGGLKPAEATSLGVDDKLMPISVHQASQTSRIRSSKQQDLSLTTSLGVGRSNGQFTATISGRQTKASRSTVSGGVRQYTRSLSGSTLFEVGGKLGWKLEHAEKPIEGSVDGGLHLWVSSDLVKATSGLGKPLPLRPLAEHEHSPLATTPIHMAVNGGGMDTLRAEIAKKNPDLASEFGNGRFAAELPLLSGGGVRVAPGVHWDVTPTGRPQVLKTLSVYVESHGEAGTAVDHDLEVRQGKGGSGFGGGAGAGLTGGVTVSHSRDTAQGSNTGRGENSSRLMTAKTVQMALVRTQVRHRVTGVGGRPVETVGETLVMVPLSELHNRLEHFDFPADAPEKVFEGFKTPGEGDPSPALKSGMLFGPVGAHPDGGLGLEATAKADAAFGDRDLSEQVRDLLQTPTLASQIRKLSDGGLTHPIVTQSGGRYELRIQARPIGRPVLHDTNATGGVKMYNADAVTSSERSGGSKTTSGAATFGVDTPHVTVTGTETHSGISADVETRARRDVESEGLRFSGESVDEYRQNVEYTYTITRLSHPLWNLHFGDRPPEALQKSVEGNYVSEVRVFEPKTHVLDAPEATGGLRPRLSDHAVALDWHGQEKISTLLREAGGTEQRHAPQDAAVLSKGSFVGSLHDVLKPGGAEFRGVDLGGRTLMMKRGVLVEGTLKPPKSVAFLKAGAERESFSHRDVSTTVEHSDSAKDETKGQLSVSGVTPSGVTVGGRVGVGHATEEREKTSETHSTETRPRWDRQPGGLYAVHVPVELKLDFGRGGAPRGTTVDVLVHVDAAGAEALGVPAARLRELRGEAEPEPAPVVVHEPTPEPHVEPEPHHDQPVLDAIPIDDATRTELSRFTPDELTQLESLARDTSPEDFRRLIMRISLSPGTVPEAALLERVPGLLSRDQVLHAVHEARNDQPHIEPEPQPEPEPVAPVAPAHQQPPPAHPTHATVTPLVAPFIRPGDDSVTVHTVPAGTTVYRLVDIRTALAHLDGRIEPLNRLDWIHLGRGLYTAADREGAALYDDDRFDRVMLRLTLRRDMVGMDIRESGTNAAEIGHQLGERHNGVVDVTEAGQRLLTDADFVAVHNGAEAPHEIKFHEGTFEHFNIHPDDAGVTGYGDGVLALYGDWTQRAEHLPPAADYVLAEIGRLTTGAPLPWHQVTGDHVRQLATAIGLPHDRIGELHDLIPVHMPDTVEELRAALHDGDAVDFATVKQHQDDAKLVADAMTSMAAGKNTAFLQRSGFKDVQDKADALAGLTDDRAHVAAVNDLHAAVERFTDSLPFEQRQKFEHTEVYNATGQAFARISIVELRLRREVGGFKVHVGHDFADDKSRGDWLARIDKDFAARTDDVLWIRNMKHKPDSGLKSAIDAMMASPDRRYFTVALHGSPGAVHLGNGHLSVKELAAIIRQDKSWSQNKRPVRLFSCYTGMHDNGFAHELAKALGVDVIAPNDKAWADRNGNTHVSENLYEYGDDGAPKLKPLRKQPETGAWRRFTPEGAVALELKPEEHLGRTSALTLLTRTLPRTEEEIKDWPEAAHEPLRTLAGVLAMNNSLFERHLIDQHMNATRRTLSGLLDPGTIATLAEHVPADRGDIREALHQLSFSRHEPNDSQAAHDDAATPQGQDPAHEAHDHSSTAVAFTLGGPPTPEEQSLADITTRLEGGEQVWVRDNRSGSMLARPVTLVDGRPHLGSIRLLPRHMGRLDVAEGFPERLSHSEPGVVPVPSVKPNGNQRMLFHNTSLMFGHFTGDIVRVGGGDRFGNQHLTIDKALPALFANLATQDPGTVQIFLSLIHHDRHLAGGTMTDNGFVAPANIHFRPDPSRQRAIALPAWLGDQARHDDPPPDPEPTEVNRQVTYARFRTFVDSRLADVGFPPEDRRELMDSLDWTASRFHPAPDAMTVADREALFAGLYLNAGERLDFSKKAVVLQRLSGHDVPAPLALIVRDTSPMTAGLRTSLELLHTELPAGSAAATTIQALLTHSGELRPAAPPLNAAIAVIMEHYWPVVLSWMAPAEPE
ncbi:DUF4347 domain-containing protein [Catenulispora rubra]|uniref:DUF4347 domain-containing protein n=1 Tax=Catenulispora rubra TaxID=280293 RepID=UPI001E5E797E|nr:DUF4347 domain-containing protein [Catenulispora rubra]